MSDITLSPESQIKQTNSQNEEKTTQVDKAEAITINMEANETKNIKEHENNVEISLDVINNDVEKHIGNESAGKEYMVYEYYGDRQNQAKLPTTWVQFQGAQSRLPLEGVPLDYDPYIRNSFVRLVFGIVFVMLLVTVVFTFFVFHTPELNAVFRRHGFIIGIVGMALMMGLSYSMACSACTRQVPCNIICLLLAVVGMSLICAFVTIHYRTDIIFYAVLATMVVVIVCILLACSNFDFTKYMLYVIVISVAFGALAMMVSLTMFITGTHMPMLHLGILFLGTLINVVVLTIELQTILGGKAIEMSEDDYALAAFLLYTSIVDIFLKILQIMGLLDDM